MDIAYLVVAALLWLATLGLAAGCERLQPQRLQTQPVSS